MTGFLTGVAVNIICGQLGDLTGVSAEGASERDCVRALPPAEPRRRLFLSDSDGRDWLGPANLLLLAGGLVLHPRARLALAH